MSPESYLPETVRTRTARHHRAGPGCRESPAQSPQLSASGAQPPALDFNHPNLLSKRIAARKQRLCQTLAGRSITTPRLPSSASAARKVRPRNHPHADSVEVTDVSGTEPDLRQLVDLRKAFSLFGQAASQKHSTERDCRRQRRRRQDRRRGQSLDQLCNKMASGVGNRIPRPGERHARGDQTGRLDDAVGSIQGDEGSQHQSGTGEQDDRQRDLRNHEPAGPPSHQERRSPATASLFQ